jgi:hypothetical protein
MTARVFAAIPSLLLLGSLARAEIPPPLAPSDVPPGISAKDVPPADPGPRVAHRAPLPAPAPAPPAAVAVAGWTDADSRAAARALAGECLAGSWLTRFRSTHGRRPSLRALPLRNRSSQHVATALFDRELASALGRSRELTPAAGTADLVLAGWLVAQNDASRGHELESFLLALSLLDVESGEKLWLGIHRVRKHVERTPSGVTVTRLSPGDKLDLSGNLNDSDLDAMTATLLRSLATSRLGASAGAKVVRLLPLRNRSAELVSTRFFAALVEQGLLRSRRVRIVADLEEEAADLALERKRRALAGAAAGAQLAATHVVHASLTSLVSATGSGELRRYTIALGATNLVDNGRDWSAVASVNKLIATGP